MNIKQRQMELRQQASRRFECGHDDTELRAHIIRGGSVQYVHQCLKCGARVGNPVKKAGEAPPFDEHLRESWKQQRAAAMDSTGARANDEWWSWYSDYLESPEWKSTRARVLIRAGGICEGCRLNPTTVVHHLKYDHVGKELLFELVALCDDCHIRCHEESETPV